MICAVISFNVFSCIFVPFSFYSSAEDAYLVTDPPESKSEKWQEQPGRPLESSVSAPHHPKTDWEIKISSQVSTPTIQRWIEIKTKFLIIQRLIEKSTFLHDTPSFIDWLRNENYLQDGEFWSLENKKYKWSSGKIQARLIGGNLDEFTCKCLVKNCSRSGPEWAMQPFDGISKQVSSIFCWLMRARALPLSTGSYSKSQALQSKEMRESKLIYRYAKGWRAENMHTGTFQENK